MAATAEDRSPSRERLGAIMASKRSSECNLRGSGEKISTGETPDRRATRSRRVAPPSDGGSSL